MSSKAGILAILGVCLLCVGILASQSEGGRVALAGRAMAAAAGVTYPDCCSPGIPGSVMCCGVYYLATVCTASNVGKPCFGTCTSPGSWHPWTPGDQNHQVYEGDIITCARPYGVCTWFPGTGTYACVISGTWYFYQTDYGVCDPI